MTAKTIFEGDLASLWGVSRDVLRIQREARLKKGPHWHYGPNNRIYLSRDGVGLLAEALEIRGPDKDTPPAEEEPPTELEGENSPQEGFEGSDTGVEADEVVIAKQAAEEAVSCEEKEPPADAFSTTEPPPVVEAIVREVPRNPWILIVDIEGERRKQVIRCRCNRNFIPGMRCKVRRPVSGYVWFLEGRSPRRKGRW